eukprot:TRINITY_DN8367_c0_g1_i2.p1 TRINITY_DN8367_c0_g1~~TRINITY_DN8367_c0_g1_i2.p1  ORF type:complete len:838 (-),score=146.28 TRINITY_DN8367_c0_g1_i2:35-2548(-)
MFSSNARFQRSPSLEMPPRDSTPSPVFKFSQTRLGGDSPPIPTPTIPPLSLSSIRPLTNVGLPVSHRKSGELPPVGDRFTRTARSSSIDSNQYMNTERHYDELRNTARNATKSSRMRRELELQVNSHSPTHAPRPPVSAPATFRRFQSPSSEIDGQEQPEIINLVNTRFSACWDLLNQHENRSHDDDGGNREDAEKTKGDFVRTFDRNFAEMLQMIGTLRGNKSPDQPHAETKPPKDTPPIKDSPRKQMKKKQVSSRQRNPEYFDSREIQKLIHRQVNIGILSQEEAPVLSGEISSHSKFAEVLSFLNHPLTLKINQKYAKFFDSPDWENLHSKESGVEDVFHRKNFVSENRKLVWSPEKMREKILKQAIVRDKRMKEAETNRTAVLEEHEKKIKAAIDRKEMYRLARLKKQKIKQLQQKWSIIILLLTRQAHCLEFLQQMRYASKFDEIRHISATRIQVYFRYYMRKKSRMRDLAAHKIAAFMWKVMKKRRFRKRIQAANMVVAFLKDGHDSSRVKRLIHRFRFNCLKLQRWWRNMYSIAKLRMTSLEYQFMHFEQALLTIMEHRDKFDITKQPMERRKYFQAFSHILVLPSSSSKGTKSKRNSVAGELPQALSSTALAPLAEDDNSNPGTPANQSSSSLVPSAPKTPLNKIRAPERRMSKALMSKANMDDAPTALDFTYAKVSQVNSRRMPVYISAEDVCPIDANIRNQVLLMDYRKRRMAFRDTWREHYQKILKVYDEQELDENGDPTTEAVRQAEFYVRLLNRDKPRFRVILKSKDMAELVVNAFMRTRMQQDASFANGGLDPALVYLTLSEENEDPSKIMRTGKRKSLKPKA